ncbi:mitochondrial 54S ribosomal protein mL53 KNAG_0J02120 [Huiozyma naganishii CBS 8797]|uniref:Large ribosomal subunit protein mL53 n=1 Tax=Huiozyma naganishii (strain ATCC MYA-139 / BCRC 22969 / CBS 8797 / KCTC 17520 / NBRC 10181 / NCYC 3082 / Yp74L-3) TaxID=1071383 RepID=J7RR25_HUIN7|nr:hypothetical protein KNAG_0J02120 [Kazachstania naganishii CBS 8797]CCK72293.1 hypothetical protein KNAG_0J02120 [Kazachstania naganishii CBS 8797]
MITKYFTKVFVRFNPFGKDAKTARMILSAIPPKQRTLGTKLQTELLKDSDSAGPIIKVTFKDKKEMEADPLKMTFQELSNYLDTHSRKLRLNKTIQNS